MLEITKIAEQLNVKVSQLNNERSRQLGMQEAAKKQYDKSIDSYEVKYGVKLSPENLQTEYNKVYTDLKTNIEVLKQTIEGIERGDYKNSTIPDIELEPEVEIILPEVVQVVQVEEVKQIVPVIESVKETPPTNVVEKKMVEFTPIEPNFGSLIIPEVELDIAEPKVVIEAPQLIIEEPKLVIEVPKVEEFGGFDLSALVDDNSLTFKQQAPKVAEPVFGGFDLSGLMGDSDNVLKVDNTKATNGFAAPTGFVQPAPPKFGGPELENDDFNDEPEEENFSPEGWGTPKTSTDINKNFADILGSQGIKFGE